MALLYPLKPAVFNRGQLYPANIYARPALGPYYRGLRGFGQAQRTNVQTFEDTLRQFATTPFAVNSATYMEKIRERYGFNDEQLQNTLGTIGGIVGAGTTAAIQGGLFFKTRGISFDNTLAFSRRNAQAAAGFRPYTKLQLDNINVYNTEAAKVADAVKNFNTAFENKKTVEATLSAAKETYDKVKRLRNTNPKKIKALQDLNDAKKAFEDINKSVNALNDTRKAAVATAKETAEKLSRVGVDVAQEAIEAGEAVGRKAAGLAPLLGFGVDVASLGLSAAGLVQDLRAGDIGSAVLSSIETLGDFTAVVGDIVEFTPAAPIGTIISAAGTLISTAVSALRVGFSVGEAIGRSLSPSGLKAQQLFVENLASNIAARPVSTVAALTAQVGIPYLIGRAGSRYTGKTLGNKLLYTVPNFLGNNVLGNQIRAGLTMFVSQGIAPLAQRVDQMLPTYNPEGADFVSAISLFGDLQDNLFGATRTKSILLGLADNDPNAKRDALARAWGYSDKPAYVLTAADIVEKVDVLKDAPPIIKSVLGVVGEIALDPRNFDEMVQGKINIKRTEVVSDFIYKELQRVEIAKLANQTEIGFERSIDRLIDTDKRGIFRNTNDPKTRGLIIGAVNAYLTGGLKELQTYVTKQAIQTYRGIKVGDLETDLPLQVNTIKTMVDDIVAGRYTSPLTINNLDAAKLIESAKKQHDILVAYEKTGVLPDNIKTEEIRKMEKFIGLVGSRYRSFEMDTVGKKLINDLNIKPDVDQIKRYFEASDAFANYMELTDKLNNALIFGLNPIGRMIQLGETRLLRWFNESTRSSMNTIENRMRTLTSLKEIKKNISNLPTYDQVKELLKEESGIEKLIKNIVASGRALTTSEKILVDNIKDVISKDPELAKIKATFDSNQEYYNKIIENIKQQINSLEENRSNFKMRTIDYKIGNKTETIDENNYKDQYAELQRLRAIQNPSDEEIKKRYALSAAFVDYELAINNVEVYQLYVKHYEAVINTLNLATIKADDYALNVLQGLYYFKSYFNTLIPKKASQFLKEEGVRLNATLKRTLENIEETEKSLKSNEDKQKTLEAENDIEFLKVDKEYAQVLKAINEDKQKLETLAAKKKELLGYKEGNQTIVGKIEANRAALKDLEKRVRAGEKEPVKFIESFDPAKFNETITVLNELQKVNLLNGVEFELTYVDKQGQTVTVKVNENVSKEFFISTYKNAKEITDISIVLKDNFQTQINKILNQYLGKDVFEDLLNYNHKIFDIDLKKWNALNYRDKISQIVMYINESNLSKEDKEKLLEYKTLRKIFVTLQTVAATKTKTTTTVLADKLTPDTLYRYVMQEQMKLYKGSVDPTTNTNPIVQAFVKAAEIIKQLDDNVAKNTEAITDDQKEFIEEIQTRFERVLKYTPIYKYVKSYLYDYLSHDKNKLTLFKRASISEILPDSITKYDVLSAVKNKQIATNIVNKVIEAPFVQQLLSEIDYKELRENSIVRFKMNVDSTLTKEEAELKDKVIEAFNTTTSERIIHEVEEKEVLETTVNAAKDDSRLSQKHKDNKVLEKVLEDKYGPVEIRTQLDINAASMRTVDTKNASYAVAKTVERLFEVKNFTLLPEYIRARLNMSLFYRSSTSKEITIYDYLKSENRSTEEYEEQVRSFSYRLAWLHKNYKDLIELNNVDIKDTDDLSTVTNKITDVYLKKGNIDVHIKLDSNKKSQVQYTSLFKNVLLKVAAKYLDKTASTQDVRNFLLGLSKDSNQYELLNKIVGEANKDVHRIINSNKDSVAFLDTLNNIIVDLRSFESTLKRSISNKNAELNPSVRKQALLKSNEVKEIFEDLASADAMKDPTSYKHMFFKLLHAVKDYYTEDYASKTILRSFDNFNEIKLEDGEVVFIYQTEKMAKPLKYTLFDLIFIHGLSRVDFTLLAEKVGQRMGASMDADVIGGLIATAKTSYDNLVNEYGQILTYNALTIDKEVFMKQPGATEEIYNLFTNPAVNELRQRLLLVNKIFEEDLNTNKIDFNLYYDNRYRSYYSYIQTALTEYEKNFNEGKPVETTITFNAYDKDDNKKQMFTVDLLNSAGSLKNANVLLLTTLLKLAQVNPKEFEGYIIKSPEGTRQTAVINSANIKQVIRDIFFKDAKPVQGKAQNTNLVRLDKLLANAEENLADYKVRNDLDKKTNQYKRTINILKNRITNLKALIEEFTRINQSITIDPINNFDRVYDLILKDEELAEAYFTNTIDTDSDDFVIALNARTNEYRLYRKKDIKDFKDQNTGKGIPTLNTFFVNYVFTKNNKDAFSRAKARISKHAQYSNIDLRIATEDGSVVVVVPDKAWSFEGNEALSKDLKRVMNNNYEDGTYDVSEVYIISETKFKEIKALTKLDEKDIPKVDLYTVDDDTVKPMPEVLNVQSNKLVLNLWLSDLNLIYKDRLDTTTTENTSLLLKKLSDFYSLRYSKKNLQGFVPIMRSFGGGVNLFNTTTFKDLIKAGKINTAFTTFYNAIGKEDFDLETIGTTFFKPEFIKADYDLTRIEEDLDPILVAHLKRRGLFKNIINALKVMQEGYGTSDLLSSLKYRNVYETESINELLKLKNSVYGIVKYIERTNRYAYKKLIPIIERHLKNSISEEVSSENIKNFYLLNSQINGTFYTALDKVFKDPFKKDEDASLIFNKVKKLRYAGLTNISILEAQQYYFKSLYDVVSAAKQKHYELNKTYRNNSINYLNYTSIRTVFRDFYNRNITAETLYNKLRELVPVPDTVRIQINLIAEKIFKEEQKKAKGYRSAERIADHLIYGYMIKSYLVSIKQFMDRNISDQFDGYNAIDYKRLLINTHDHLKLKDQNGTISKSEKTIYEDIKARIKNFNVIKDKDVRYKFNIEHLVYKGNSTNGLFNFEVPDAKEVAEDLKQGKLTPIDNIKIDEYVGQYVLNKFNYELSEEDAVQLTKATGDIIKETSAYLYGANKKETVRYVSPVGTLDTEIQKTDKLKQELLADGFTESQIGVMFDVAQVSRKTDMIKTDVDEYLKLFVDADEDTKNKVNLYVSAIRNIKRVKSKIKKVELDYKQIFEVNRLDLLENSTKFFSYFKDVIRNFSRDTPEKDIINAFKQFGIGREEIFSILDDEYETISHFINAHIKNKKTDESKDTDKAHVLMLFINYHKNKFIEEVLEQKDYQTSNSVIKEVRSYETIRDRDNNLKLQTLNINNVLGTGNSINNSINFYLNRGFILMNKVNRRVNFYNDRLNKIIFDDNDLKENDEYTGEYHGIIYKDNNIKTVASQIQRNTYEALFRETDAGFVGGRAYELMLMRREFVQDIMAENASRTRNVGSSNVLYNNLRITWTELLETIKKDFKEYEFIRVRDVTTAIGTFTKNKAAVNYFVEQYNLLVRAAKERYILANAKSGKDQDTLLEEFDKILKSKVDAIIDISFNNNKIVQFDERNIKAILGFIYTSRFIDSNEVPEVQNQIASSIKQQLEDDIKYKQYKFNTISSVIKRIIKSKDSDEKKKKQLAALQNKTFDQLSPEQQETIETGLRINNYILGSDNFYSPKQFYDTFDVAYGLKNRVGAETTITMQREAAEELGIQTLKNTIEKTEGGINTTIQNTRDLDKQNKLFTIENAPEYYTYDKQSTLVDGKDIERQADLASFILQEQLSTARTKLKEEEKIFNQKKIELVQELFKQYPNLRLFYLKKAEEKIRTSLNKEDAKLEKLNNNTDQKIINEYQEYLKDVEAVKAIEATTEYKIITLFKDEFDALLRIGTDPVKALETLFEFFKDELKSENVNSVKELGMLYVTANKEKLFERLKQKRDQRDARGTTFKNSKDNKAYDKYVKNRIFIDANIAKYNKQITNIQLSDVDELTADFTLQTLTTIIDDFKNESKTDLGRTFKTIDRKDNFTELNEEAKKQITARHLKLYNERMKYLKQAYLYVREFNKDFGLADAKDLGKVINDKQIKPAVLISAIEKELAILETHRDALKNKKIVTVPEAIKLPELKDEDAFKKDIYFIATVEIRIKKLESDLKRELTQQEVDRIVSELNTTFEKLDVLNAYNFMMGSFKNKKSYRPITNVFGSTGIDFDLSTYNDNQVKYAEALISQINNRLVNNYNESVDTTISSIESLMMESKLNIDSLKLEQSILERKNKVPTVSDTENLKKLFNNMHKDIEGKPLTDIDDNTLNTLLRFVSNNKTSAQINTAAKEVETINDKIKEIESFKKAVTGIEARREGVELLKLELLEKEEQLVATKKEREALYKNELEVAGDKLSNLEVFKHYYKIKKDATETEVIDTVLNMVKARFPEQDVEKLKRYIRSRGDYALHNSVVDSLVTLFNYIHQKPDAKRYVVIDLETYKLNGEDTPYQITMAYEENGKLVLNDVFINSALFFDGLNDDGSYKDNMVRFYEQQKSIWRKQWASENLSEEAFEIKAKAAMDKLINKVRLVKNNDNFINTFLTLIGDSKVEIVAHNGFRFDFNLIKNFISRIGDNLIVNEYYRNLTSTDVVRSIYDNIDKTNLNDDEITKKYIEELQLEYEKTIADLNKNLPTLTLQEADKFKRKLDIINRKSTELKVKQRVKAASEQTGYILNDNIRNQILDVSTGAIKYINDEIYKYINEKDPIKQGEIKSNLVLKFMEGATSNGKNVSVQKIIMEYVDNLINSVQTMYSEYIQGTRTINFGSTKVGTSIKTELNIAALDAAGIKLYEEDVELNLGEQLQVLEAAIEANNNLAEALKISTQPADIVAQRQAEIETIKETINAGKEEIARLQQDQSALQTSNEELIDKIIEVAQKISNNNVGYAREINIALNNIEEQIGSNTAVKALGLLKNQQKIAFNNLTTKVENLVNLAAAIKKGTPITDYTEFLGTKIDTRLVDVINGTATAKDALDSVQKDIDLLIKAVTDTEDAAVKNVLKTIFTEFIKEQEVILKQTKAELVRALEKLLNLKQFEGVSIKDGEILFNNKAADADAIKKIYDLITDVPNQKFFEENTAVVSAVTRLLNNYESTLRVTNTAYEDVMAKTNTSLFEVFKNVVKDRYEALLQTKEYLSNYKEKRPGKALSTDALLIVYKSVLQELTGQEVIIDQLKNQTVISLITGDIPSQEMSDTVYAGVASSTIDLEEVYESKLLKDLGIKVHYDDPEKGNDIQVLRTVSNKVLSKQFTNATDPYSKTLIFTVLDQEFNEDNKVVYNTKSNTLDVTLKYAYIPAHLRYSGGSSRGYQVHEKNFKVVLGKKDNLRSNEYTFKDLENFISQENFYWKDTKSKDKYVILPNVRQDELHFINGVDSSKDAIVNLIKWVIKNKQNFVTIKDKDGDTSKDENLEKANKLYESVLTHEKFAFNEKYLQVINISKKIKDQFFAELALYQSTQKLTATNIKEIYAGIYNRITSRYKALEPGSIVNQINDNYTYDYNLESFDSSFLDKHDIELELNSEGSAGAVFKYKTRYGLNFPFTLSTNAIRTMLSGKHILAKYTTVGFLNDIYGDIKTKQAPGKLLLDTFIKDPTKYLKNKEIANTFIRKTKTSNTQVFMPNVMSEELYKGYKEDSMVHQFGATVPVSFVKDPRIPLDVIAVDADFARASNWGQGNKTWLGLHYGFKGAVRYIPGLYKTYGSYFAASADSVFSRGTAGVYGEMLFNYIRAYLINETDNTGKSVVPARTRKYFDAIKNHLETKFRPLLNNDDNVLIVNPRAVYEMFEELSIAIKDKLGNEPEFKDVSDDKLYQVLLMRDFKEEDANKDFPDIITPTIVKPEDLELNEDFDMNKAHERRFIKTETSDSSYVRGLIYVYADHENSAQAMQTITKVNTAGKLIRNVVDSNNNVVKGLSISPTVSNAMLAIIGRENFLKVFTPTYDTLNLLTDVRALGFRTIVNNTVGIINEEEITETTYETFINRLLDAYQNKKIHEYVYTQGIKYLALQLAVNTSQENTIGYKKEIEKLVTNTESNVLEKIYDGRNSAYYKASFKRWDGIRQQFLADVTLDAGEIVLSKKAWEAVERKNNKDNPLIKTEEMSDATKVKQYIDTVLSFENIKDQIEFLKSRGIFEETNKEFYLALETGVKKGLYKFKLNQTYTYLLSARSPVQDYGAVPVFKAIGYSESYAANVNVYAYNMMGADNDGDTFGMALLKISDVENGGPLAKLLSTDLNYYTFDENISDDGKFTTYLEKSNEEMYGKDKVDITKDVHTMGKVDLISYKFTRNQTGKNTFNAKVRPNKEYLEVEQYRLIEPDMFTKLGEAVKDKIIAVDTKNVALLKLYVNAHIRINNKGDDFDNNIIFGFKDYEDSNKLNAYYNKYKSGIDLIYTIENNLNNNNYIFGKDITVNDTLYNLFIKNFSEEEQKILNDKKHKDYNKIYKRLVLYILSKKQAQFTTSRVRASKNGVLFAGDKRKDQYISSFISTYPNINRSKQGLFWKLIGASNDEGEVTMRSLIQSILNVEVFNPVDAYNKLLAIKEGTMTVPNEALNNPVGVMKYFIKDLPLVIDDAIKILDTYLNGGKELEALFNLSRQKKVSKEDILNFLNNSSKKSEPVFANYIKHFSTNLVPDEVSKTYVKEIAMYYFNNAKTLADFLKNRISIDTLMKGYLDQYVIERVAQNNMSRLIQESISMSKHDGQDTDPNARTIRYRSKVEGATVRKSIRKIILGTDSIESLLGMAINVDRNIRERVDLKFDRVSSNSINKEYYEKYPNNRPYLKQNYLEESTAVKDINALIKERAKLYLLGNLFMPDSMVSKLYLNIQNLNNALNNPANFLQNKDAVLSSIRFFNTLNIPFYKIITFLRDGLSIKQVVSERYSKNYNIAIDKVPLLKNAGNVLRLMYMLRDSGYKSSFDKRYGNETEFINFFNNVNDMDEGWFIIDEEGNRVLITPESDPSKEDVKDAVTQEDVQTAVSFAGTNNSAILQKTSDELEEDTINKVAESITDKLKYTTFASNIETIEERLNNLRMEIELLLKSDDNLEEAIKASKKNIKELNLKTTDQNALTDKRTRKAIRSYSNIKQLAFLSVLENKKNENEQKIKDIEKVIKKKESELVKANKSLENVERIKNWYASNLNPIEKLQEENKLIQEEIETIKKKAIQNAIVNNLGGGVLLLRTPEGYGLGDSNIGKPRYLTQEDLDAKRNESLLAMENKVTALTTMIDSNNLDMSLKNIYEFMRKEQADYRLVIVEPPHEDEGAARTILNDIRKFDANKDTNEVLFKSFSREEMDALKFKSLQELEDYKGKGKVVFAGKVYEYIDPKVVIEKNRFLTPTYKEITVRSVKELKEVYETAKGTVNGVKPIIGFIDLNTWMQAMENTYNSRRIEGSLQRRAYALQLLSKNLSKFSAAFLFRNLSDTVYQLFSNAQILPKSVESKDFTHMTMTSLELMNLYEKYSDEHTASIINIGLHYEDILELAKMPTVDTKKIEEKLGLMKEVLESYITIGKNLEEPNDRINYYIPIVERLYRELNTVKADNVLNKTKVLYDTVTFISNIRFGEYLELYDNRVINGKNVAGLRIDSRDVDGKVRTNLLTLNKVIKEYSWKKKLLKQLSAFMNTAATSDYLRKDNFELLPEVFEKYRGYNEKDFSNKTYEEIKAMIKEQRDLRRNKKGFAPFRSLSSKLINAYDDINTKIENAARITNFLYNLMIYNKTFDESVLLSLRSWFNYGMRSPLEQRLMADIPFISFPIRSIQNWIDRINNPRWWRFMSDFFDGWYGQYIDEEEKEYNDYIKYQMRNGWIPLSPTFGIRLGNGALDVMNMLYNTQEAFEGRISPILRGVKTLAEKRNVFEALNQLASLGLIGRLANTVTGVSDMALQTNLRQQAAQVPVARELLETRPASIGTTFRGFAYDIKNYEKYTPRRYRYGSNGRYAKYENIYRDWFNKYGRMRKPKVNPYSLVKDIQWRQYVRWRQSRNIIG